MEANKCLGQQGGDFYFKGDGIVEIAQATPPPPTMSPDEIQKMQQQILTLQQTLNGLTQQPTQPQFNQINENKARAFLKYPRKYSRNSNGVVSDGYGLEWEDARYGFWNKNFKGNFNEAKNYCKNLNLDGKTDWRLPTNKELWYLADRTKQNPAISPVFKNVKTNTGYWADQIAYYDNEQWQVKFESGFGWSEPKNNQKYARCVRGKSFYENIEFSRDDRNEIVTDKTNNLMWQDTSNTVKKNWNKAKSYCSNLTLGGYSDWRLPEIGELYSITDQRKTSRPFVNSKFKNIKSSWHWSNSPIIKYSSESWIVNFFNGNANWISHYSDGFVVCVRDAE